MSSTHAGFHAKSSGQLMKNLRAGQKQTIVTYGTSLTEQGAWVQQLQQFFNERFPGLAAMINSGKSAMWSQWGVENLDERVIGKKPDAVFMEFSINDAFLSYKTSVAQARANLTTMIDRITAANASCEVVLMTMNPPVEEHLEQRPEVELYNQIYRDVARERGLMLIDCYPEWKAILEKSPDLFRRYVPDGIHPANEGNAMVTTPAILKALGLNCDKGSDASCK